MSKDYSELDSQLISLSATIDDFMANKSKFPAKLEDVERWLHLQQERISLMKLENNNPLRAEKMGKQSRMDGMIVFDSDLTVLNYSGPRNYFHGSDFDHCEKVTLRSFFSDTDVKKIQEVLKRPTHENENPGLELLIKTGPGIATMCLVQPVPLPSNASCYMALLRFPVNPEQLLSTYQNMILDSLPGMDIYLFDRDFKYIIVAGQEKQRYGLSNVEMVGKTLFEVVDKKTQRSLFPFYNKAISGIATEGEIRFDNQVYYVIAKPFEMLEDRTIAGMIILQNVTNDKILEQQLRKRKDEAQKSDRTKSIFIANLSHEMRTPLNAIIGFSDQLKKTDLTDDQSKLISLTGAASSHLLYLVNEVVFLFKLGMGKVYIEMKPFSLRKLIREIEEIMLLEAKEKQLTFAVKYDGVCPDLLIGDPFRLRQIIMNLLVNAMKFTDEGSVTLKCSVKKSKGDMVLMAFAVEDTGIGIKKENLSAIFDIFEQGDIRAENVRGGAGLGLGICQRLTRLLKGEIKVKSKLGTGSTFTAIIPFEKVIHQEIPLPSRKFAISDDLLIGKKIFLADDDPHNLLLSELIFKGWKVDFQLAPDGSQAFKILEEDKFDIVLLDIQMPGKTGLQIVEFIRSKPNHKNHSTPIISISANVLKSDIHHYLETGFNDYLTKPFREEEMYNVLCANLLVETQAAQITGKNLSISNDQTEVLSAVDEINLRQLRKTAAGDKTFEKTILQNFRDQSSVLSKDFNIGLMSQNWKKIGEKAHKAIPSFKYFGLEQTVVLLQKVESKALREKNFSNMHDLVKQSGQRISQIIDQFDQLLDEIKKEE